MKYAKHHRFFTLFSLIAALPLTLDAREKGFSVDNINNLQQVVNDQNIAVDGAPAIVIQNNNEVLTNNAQLSTTGLTDTVAMAGENSAFVNQQNGEVSSELFGVSARGVNNTIENAGVLTGDIFAINFDIGSTGLLQNNSTISSNGRAVHVAGNDVTVVNRGEILGTGDQFDGAFYLDAPGEKVAVFNNGLIDAGAGNNGAGASFEIGDETGDEVIADLVNNGQIIGRGIVEEGTLVGDSVRVFSVLFENTVVKGNFVNRGEIIGSTESTVAVGISIEDGVNFTGAIINQGTISGTETAIDTAAAGGRVSIRNTGRINGNIVLSAGNDVFSGGRGAVNGSIDGGEGNDRIFAGVGNDTITGGPGSDRIDGGRGNDTAVFAGSQADFTVEVSRGRRSRVNVTNNITGDIDTLSRIETLSFDDGDIAL